MKKTKTKWTLGSIVETSFHGLMGIWFLTFTFDVADMVGPTDEVSTGTAIGTMLGWMLIAFVWLVGSKIIRMVRTIKRA